jgi:hypothetical protein
MTRQAIHHMGFLKGRSVREITIAAQEHFPDEGGSERSVRRILKEVSCVDVCSFIEVISKDLLA